MATLLIDRGADVNYASEGLGVPLFIACLFDRVDVAKLLLDRDADVDRTSRTDDPPLCVACLTGHVHAAQLCLERGASVNWTSESDQTYRTLVNVAHFHGHEAMALWLARIVQAGSWKRHLSEPRYQLVVLKELVAGGRARRARAFHGKEQVLDLLFPGDRQNTRAKRHPPRLPDELFAIIARYYGAAAECRPKRRWPPPPRPRRPHASSRSRSRSRDGHDDRAAINGAGSGAEAVP